MGSVNVSYQLYVNAKICLSFFNCFWWFFSVKCGVWRWCNNLEDCAITRRAAFTDSGARVGNYPTAVRTMARDSENSWNNLNANGVVDFDIPQDTIFQIKQLEQLIMSSCFFFCFFIVCFYIVSKSSNLINPDTDGVDKGHD